VIFQDFQPGDGTRYVMGLDTVPVGTPEADLLGCRTNGGYVVVVVNLHHVLVLSKGQPVTESWIISKIYRCNPWTARAIILWLATQEVELELDEPGPEPA
jgi:hypothetical protein